MMSGKVFIPNIELSLGDAAVVAVLVSFHEPDGGRDKDLKAQVAYLGGLCATVPKELGIQNARIAGLGAVMDGQAVVLDSGKKITQQTSNTVASDSGQGITSQRFWIGR